MDRHIILQIKLGGERHMEVIDPVVVDDRWLHKFNSHSATTRYKGQGWGAYAHIIVPYTKESLELFKKLSERDSDGHSEGYLDQTELSKILLMSNETLLNGKAKELIGASHWDFKGLVRRKSRHGKNPHGTKIDRAAWLAGIADIDSSGLKDYLTLASFEGDIGYGSITANIGARYTSAVAEPGICNFVGNLNGYGIEVYQQNGSGGVPSSGDIITLSGSGSAFINCNFLNPAYAKFHHINFKNGGSIEHILGIFAGTDSCDLSVYKCVFDHGGNANDALQFSNSAYSYKINNNVIFNVGDGTFKVRFDTTDFVFEGNIIYGTNRYGISCANGGVCRNNIILVDGNELNTVSATDGYKNYYSGSQTFGGTSIGNISGGDSSVLASIVPTESDFLKPIASSDIDGTADDYTLGDGTGIGGNAWNSTIGPSQLPSSDPLVILCVGQSNMVGFGSTPYNTRDNDNEYMYNSSDALVLLSDPTGDEGGSLLIELANLVSAENPGRQIIMINRSISGSPLSAWASRTSGSYYQLSVNAVNAATGNSGADFVVFYQGESEVVLTPAYSDWLGYMNDLITDYKGEWEKNTVFINVAFGQWTNPLSNDQSARERRKVSIIPSDGSTVYHTQVCDYADNNHLITSELDKAGERIARIVNYHNGCESCTGWRGPYVSEVFAVISQDKLSVTLPVLNGSSMAPLSTELLGFRFVDGTGSITPNSVQLYASPDRIVATFDDEIRGTLTVGFLDVADPNVLSVPYGTYDGIEIGLETFYFSIGAAGSGTRSRIGEIIGVKRGAF